MGNIIGDPFEFFVKNQVEVRQNALGQTSNISIDNLKYYTTKTPWLRLASSINLTGEEGDGSVLDKLLKVGVNKELIVDNRLAKNFILQGGAVSLEETTNEEGKIISSNAKLQKGLNYNNELFNGAYGWGGLNEQSGGRGYVPMPGIESAQSTYYNNGALSKATIKIKCFSKAQFQLLDVLYLRPGYTLLLEFGWSTYLNNEGVIETYDGFKSSPLSFLLNPSSFPGGKNQFQMLDLISNERIKHSGNYEAIYGKITNFKWSFGSDGSYNCEVTLIGMGSIIESLKLNVISTTKNDNTNKPEESNEFPKFQEYLQQKLGYRIGNMVFTHIGYSNKRTIIQFNDLMATDGVPPSLMFDPDYQSMVTKSKGKNIKGITPEKLEKIKNFYRKLYVGDKEKYEKNAAEYDAENANNNPLIGNKDETKLNKIFYEAYQTLAAFVSKDEIGGVWSWFYKTPNGAFLLSNTRYGEKDNEGDKTSDSVYLKFGVLLNIIEDNCNLFSLKDEITPMIKFDFNLGAGLKNDDNYMSIIPPSFSSNPQICLVNYQIASIPNSDINYDQQIKVFTPLNTALGKEQNFIKEDNSYVGRLGNVLINLRFAASVLADAPRDDEGAISVLSYIQTILKGVNQSMGSINNFKVTYDESSGLIKIWDETPMPNLSNSPSDTFTKINIFGVKKNQGSFVTNIGLDAEIPEDFATMISIGAQLSGNNLQGNATSFSNYNKGLIDRVIPEKLDTHTSKNKDEKEEDTAKQILTEKIYYPKSINKISPFGSIYIASGKSGGATEDTYDFTPEVCSVLTENYKDYLQLVQGEFSKSKILPSPFFLPFNLNLEMEGLSGIKLFEKFRISDDILPPSYEKDSVDIIVKAINHNIDIQSWKTTVDTQSVPRHTPIILSSNEKALQKASEKQAKLEAAAGGVPSNDFQEYVDITPWSAAYISWVMEKVGISFPSSGTHTDYAQKIRNGGYPWEALDPFKTVLELGDIIVKGRFKNTGTEEDPVWVKNNLKFTTPLWDGPSHGDIVTGFSKSLLQ